MIRRKSLAPSSVRKQPETFVFTFTILRSRSAWLLSKGTSKLTAKRQTDALCFLRRSISASTFPRLRLPLCLTSSGERGFSLYAQRRICPYRRLNAFKTLVSRRCRRFRSASSFAFFSNCSEPDKILPVKTQNLWRSHFAT